MLKRNDDHIVPQSRCNSGPQKSSMNLTRTCAKCNGQRGDAPMLHWLADPETAAAPNPFWIQRRTQYSPIPMGAPKVVGGALSISLSVSMMMTFRFDRGSVQSVSED